MKITILYKGKKYYAHYTDENEFIGNVVYCWQKTTNENYKNFRMFSIDGKDVCYNVPVKDCPNKIVVKMYYPEKKINDLDFSILQESLGVYYANDEKCRLNLDEIMEAVKKSPEIYIKAVQTIRFSNEINFHCIRSFILESLVKTDISFSVKKNKNINMIKDNKIYKAKINTLVSFKKNLLIFCYEKNLWQSATKALMVYSKNPKKTVWFVNVHKDHLRLGKIENGILQLYYKGKNIDLCEMKTLIKK